LFVIVIDVGDAATVVDDDVGDARQAVVVVVVDMSDPAKPLSLLSMTWVTRQPLSLSLSTWVTQQPLSLVMCWLWPEARSQA
jgi:hypothetical protein